MFCRVKVPGKCIEAPSFCHPSPLFLWKMDVALILASVHLHACKERDHACDK